MPVFNKDSKLSEPLLYDPSLIPVINRFDLFLGVGDASISEACKSKNINLDFFLAVINTYLNKDYFPDYLLEDIHIDLLIDYLDKTDTYYTEVQLPNIERHFNLLMQKCAYNTVSFSSLELLRKFFIEVKEEMNCLVGNDCKFWFPLFRENLVKAREIISDKIESGNDNIPALPFNHHLLEEKIQDLMSFFIIHLKGNYNTNLCVAVVSAIFTLAKDVRQNNRIRDRILQPLCIG